jgi:hypothetical protein
MKVKAHLICASSMVGFVDEVNKALDKGLAIHGSPFVVTYSETYICQLMVELQKEN